MTEKDKNDYESLVKFWNKALNLSEEDRAKEISDLKSDDWKEFAPSEKLFYETEKLAKNNSVLDYGCGTGWASLVLAKSGCNDVTAVDVTPNGIDMTDFYAKMFNVQDKINSKSITSTWLVEQPAECFDGIICSNVLDVIPSEMAEEIIAEFARILKPEGKIVVGLNYFMSKEMADKKNVKLENGNCLYVDGILRMVSLSDEDWKTLFEKYFVVEKLDHFAWPGEEKETRRLFVMGKK